MPKLGDLPEYTPEYHDPVSDQLLVALYNAENPHQHTVIRNVTVAEVAVMMLKEKIHEYFAENNPNDLKRFQIWIEKRLSRDCNSN